MSQLAIFMERVFTAKIHTLIQHAWYDIAEHRVKREREREDGWPVHVCKIYLLGLARLKCADSDGKLAK